MLSVGFVLLLLQMLVLLHLLLSAVRQHVLLHLPDHEQPVEDHLQLGFVERGRAVPHGAVGDARALGLQVEHVGPLADAVGAEKRDICL